jgi:hypothetical protein
MSAQLPRSVTRLVWRGDALLIVRWLVERAQGGIHERWILECLDESGGRRWQHALNPLGARHAREPLAIYAPTQLAIDPAGINRANSQLYRFG